MDFNELQYKNPAGKGSNDSFDEPIKGSSTLPKGFKFSLKYGLVKLTVNRNDGFIMPRNLDAHLNVLQSASSISIDRQSDKPRGSHSSMAMAKSASSLSIDRLIGESKGFGSSSSSTPSLVQSVESLCYAKSTRSAVSSIDFSQWPWTWPTPSASESSLTSLNIESLYDSQYRIKLTRSVSSLTINSDGSPIMPHCKSESSYDPKYRAMLTRSVSSLYLNEFQHMAPWKSERSVNADELYDPNYRAMLTRSVSSLKMNWDNESPLMTTWKSESSLNAESLYEPKYRAKLPQSDSFIDFSQWPWTCLTPSASESSLTSLNIESLYNSQYRTRSVSSLTINSDDSPNMPQYNSESSYDPKYRAMLTRSVSSLCLNEFQHMAPWKSERSVNANELYDPKYRAMLTRSVSSLNINWDNESPFMTTWKSESSLNAESLYEPKYRAKLNRSVSSINFNWDNESESSSNGKSLIRLLNEFSIMAEWKSESSLNGKSLTRSVSFLCYDWVVESQPLPQLMKDLSANEIIPKEPKCSVQDELEEFNIDTLFK
uniref:Uncharacterized protein n=2 Tax=Clytia hemisphaerica TaxID=252671 RepID=A0A7M5VE01_9CNID